MENITRWLIVTVFAVGVTALSGTVPAMAQGPGEGEGEGESSCTISCACGEKGCGCSTEDGDGSACTSSGSHCFVSSCEAEEEQQADFAFFAPDGSVLTRSVDSERIVIRPMAVSSWETLPNGVTVGRNCSGIIVSRFITPARAAALRMETRVLTTAQQ